MSFFLPALLLATLPLNAAGGAVDAPPSAPGETASQPGKRPPHSMRPPSREQVSMRIMVRQLLLNRYDADHDGELKGEERSHLMQDAKAARTRQAIAFIRRFDADGDGKLNAGEREAMRQAMKERRRAQAGAMGEAPPHAEPAPEAPMGKQTDSAKQPHRHAGERGPHGQHHGKRHESRPPHPRMGEKGRLFAMLVRELTMAAYDADSNGILDTAESARLREDGAKLYAAREAELLAQYDADKDGALSEAELQTALAERFPHPQGTPPHADATQLPPPPPLHGQEKERWHGQEKGRWHGQEKGRWHGQEKGRWHGNGREHGRGHGPINRLLDTHFDLDILLHLARPQGESPTPPPCAPSTPSVS